MKMWTMSNVRKKPKQSLADSMFVHEEEKNKRDVNDAAPASYCNKYFKEKREQGTLSGNDFDDQG